MLTEREHAELQRRLGYTVHEHRGIWWQNAQPFYTKPLIEFRPFRPGQFRPRFTRSFLGYSHQVPDPALGNRVTEYMVLDGDDLRQFAMGRLRSEKRNQVRKGLKSCQVAPITDLRPHLEEAREINITQARRQMETGSFGRPVTYYTEQGDPWRTEVLSHFGLKGWNWWGAMAAGRLVAYMLTLQVEQVMFIMAMKTHTEFLKLCPTDALYFTVLEQAAQQGACARVINGGPLRESLNRYKEQFLFKRTPFPYYTANARLFRFALRLLHLKERLRFKVQAAHGHGRVRSPAVPAGPAFPDAAAPKAGPPDGESRQE